MISHLFIVYIIHFLHSYILFTSQGFSSGKIGFLVLENPEIDTGMTIVCLRVPEIEIGNFGAKIVRHLVCRSRDIRHANFTSGKIEFIVLQNPKMTIILQINMFL
jgi:hypothetical protein